MKQLTAHGGPMTLLKLMIVSSLVLSLLGVFTIAAPPTPPQVPTELPPEPNASITILQPDDGLYSKSATVTFRFTTLFDGSCDLYVNESDIHTWSSVSSATTSSFTDRSLTNGVYEWYLACTDTNGNSQETGTRLLTIDTTTPVLRLATPAGQQGEYADLNGSHFIPGTVSFNISNSSGVVDETSLVVNDDGTFSGAIFMKYNYAPGSYTFTSFQEGYPVTTQSVTYALAKRNVQVMTDKESYVPGETVQVTGIGFAPASSVTLWFLKPDQGTYVWSTPTDANGTISYAYVLSGRRATGQYTLNATDDRFPTLKDSITFTLEASGQPATKDPCPTQYTCLTSQPTNGVEEDYACTAGVCYGCSPGSHLDGSSCVADLTCTPQCQSGQWQCVGTQIAYCAPVNGCLLWGQGQNCSEGQQCSADAGCSTPNLPAPVTQKPSFLGGVSLLLLIGLAALLLIGGTVGYLAYEGKLDLHDLGGTLRGLLHPEARGPGTPDESDADEVKHFIFSQRARGYDDLTIRNALVERGWGEKEVDAIFQEIYKD
jgi:hypothetical protein